MDSERDLICCGLELRFWPIAKEYLKASIAMNRGAFTEEDIYNLIVEERMQLWGVHDGDLKSVIVTEIVIYPRLKRLRLVLLGGHQIDDWESVASDTFDNFAKAHGCAGIEIMGRRGWVKRLKSYGYEELETIVLKDIVC